MFVCMYPTRVKQPVEARKGGWVSWSLSGRWFAVAQYECRKLNLGDLKEKEHSYLLSHLSYPLHCRLHFSMKYFEISAEHNGRSFINSEFVCVKWDELIKYWVNHLKWVITNINSSFHSDWLFNNRNRKDSTMRPPKKWKWELPTKS